MKTFAQFLFESLVKIEQSDIKMIYDPIKAMATDLKTIFKHKTNQELTAAGKKLYDKWEFYTEPRNYMVIDSSRLKSKKCKEAHEILPIKIEVGVVPGASYNPVNKVIRVGVTMAAFKAALLQIDLDMLKQYPVLVREFDELRIKSTIQHELVHWIDDALNNNHMTKNSKTNDFKKYLYGGKRDVGLGYIEIQAQVNQINFIKKKLGTKKWNSITWEEMVVLHPALDSLNTRLGAEWRKIIIPRMAREGILGKNMKF